MKVLFGRAGGRLGLFDGSTLFLPRIHVLGLGYQNVRELYMGSC